MKPNAQQEIVINTLDRNIIMTASAGTGKTDTLSRRIANILQKDLANASEILCITFTNRACKEIKSRVSQTVGKAGNDVVIKTIHSFCYDMIKLHAKDNDDMFCDFVIFDDEDCFDVIKKIEPDIDVRDARNFIEKLKYHRTMLDYFSKDAYADYKRTFDQLYNSLNETTRYSAKLVYLYEKTLMKMNALDFDDLLMKTYILLKQEHVRSIWNNKFKYIHIDEMQDVNLREYKVLTNIFGNNKILLCGDYFQTIYEWRGSNPNTLIKEYKDQYDPIVITLDTNYRSTKSLVYSSLSVLKGLFEQAGDVYKNGILSNNECDGEAVLVHNVLDTQAESEWILKQIECIDDISKVCVLARTNNYCRDLSEYFAKMDTDIKFVTVDEFQFFKRSEIKDVLSFLKLIVNPYDEISLKRIVLKYAKNIGIKTVESIENARKYGIRLTDFLEKGSYLGYDPFHYLLNHTGSVIIFDVESTGVDTTKDDIIQIAAIKIDSYGNEIDSFERFLKPSKLVGSSVDVHGFTDEFLNEFGELAEDVLTDFLEFSKDSIVIGHNVSYDINIFTSQLLRNGLPRPQCLAVYDTLDLARRFYPNLRSHKLEYLSEYFSLENKSSHDASDDILATRDLLMKILDEHIRVGSPYREKIIKEHIHKFGKFFEFMESIKTNSYLMRPYELVEFIIQKARIKQYYEKVDAKTEHMDYLIRLFEHMDNKDLSFKDALIYILSLTSLSNSELDTYMNEAKKIPIITVHQAKGMEFDYVFMAGMYQNLFPSFGALKEKRNGNISRYEEEKRLFYVAITRAKKRLYISYPTTSKQYTNAPSEFLQHLSSKHTICT